MVRLVGTKEKIWWMISSGKELIKSTPPKRGLGFRAPVGAVHRRGRCSSMADGSSINLLCYKVGTSSKVTEINRTKVRFGLVWKLVILVQSPP